MKKFDSSYDRGQAMNLAALLAGKKTQINMPNPKGSPAQTPASVEEAPPAQITFAPTPEITFRDEGVYRDQVWKILLGWSLEAAHCSWGYVSDGSGLVISETGKPPQCGEEIPSMMVSALDQLKRCSEEGNLPKRLLAQLDDLWITALIFGGEGDQSEAMVIGLVSNDYPKPEAVKHVGKVFKEKIAES